MTIIGAGIAAYLVRFTTNLLDDVEQKARIAERSYDELNAAMGVAQASAQRIGESLSASVARTTATGAPKAMADPAETMIPIPTYEPQRTGAPPKRDRASLKAP